MKMMNNWNAVVIINGSGGCGKSEFIKQCRYSKILPVYEFSSVDWVKEVAKFCGWDGSKEVSDRMFLYNLKMALEKWDDSPTTSVLNAIENTIDGKTDNLFFVNIREIYNIVRFKLLVKEKLHIPCYDLLVRNKNVPVIKDSVPDAGTELHEYDFYINNDGDINELAEKAKDFIKRIYPYAE